MTGSADKKGKASDQVVSLDLGELSVEDVDALHEWLAGDHPKLVHDSKSAMHVLWSYDFEPVGVIHDTFLIVYLPHLGQRNYSSDNVIQWHLGQTFSQVGGQTTLLDGPAGGVSHVAAVTDPIERLAAELSEAGLYSMYTDLEVSLAPVLGRVERVSIAVGVDAFEELCKQAQTAIDNAESAARNLVNKSELNPGSSKQLQEVLFDQLGMPKMKEIETGYSAATKEIEGLAKVSPHPLLDYLLKFRESQEIKSTVEELIKAVAGDDRIHMTFNQTVMATGCLPSTEPNLQNVPVRAKFGRRTREAFIVSEGHAQLTTVDYSQIGMCMVAYLSQDPRLIEAYRQGEDLYNYVGSKVLGVGIDEITPELRRRVRAMNYGLAYGLSTFGLTQQLDIPQREAKRLTEDYFERFGGARDYLYRVAERVRKDGFTTTIFDRRRYLPELNADNHIARDDVEHATLNSPI